MSTSQTESAIRTSSAAAETTEAAAGTALAASIQPHTRFTGQTQEPMELSADVLKLLDDLDHQAARADVALQTVARSLTVNATNPQFFYELGCTLEQRRRYDHAAEHYRRAIQIQPQFAAAHLGLARLARGQGRLNEAAATLRSSLELCPRDAALYAELAAVLEAQDRLGEAATYLRLAAEADPALARAWFRLGGVLMQQGETREARECFARGLQGQAADPQTRLVRSLVALQLGDFSTGWEDFDLRRDSIGRDGIRHGKPNVPAAPPVVWDEARLARQTILVRSEGNPADDLMFASCLTEFGALAGRCLVECDPAMAPLFARSFPGMTIVDGRGIDGRGSDVPGHRPDAEIHIGSLPRYLRPSPQSFPGRRGYLRPDAQRKQYWRDRLRAIGPGLKVGISWRCGRSAEQTVERSVQLACWEEVLRVPGVRFVSLQRGDCAAEIAQAREGIKAEIHEVLPSGRRELDDQAALIAALDLVISVPNTVSHLAGALGAEAWVPLASWPSWRWLLEGDACPWYPSLRLFRQTRRGRWDDVLAHVAGHLRNAETATCAGK